MENDQLVAVDYDLGGQLKQQIGGVDCDLGGQWRTTSWWLLIMTLVVSQEQPRWSLTVTLVVS